MKPLPYRARRVDTNEWVYGSFLGGRLCHILSHKTVKRTDSTSMFAGHEVLPVKPDSVSQSTGRKDKHKQDIYGDSICVADYDEYFVKFVYPNKVIGVWLSREQWESGIPAIYGPKHFHKSIHIHLSKLEIIPE